MLGVWCLFEVIFLFFFFSSRRRHTRSGRVTWSSDVCSSDLYRDRRMSSVGYRYHGAHPNLKSVSYWLLAYASSVLLL